MYRNSAHLSMAKTHLPSPAPDDLSDSDSDITAELQRKRRQIDEEITAFKAHKEKEFRAFEKELQSRRSRRSQSPNKRSAPFPTSTTTPQQNVSALSLLASAAKSNKLTNGDSPDANHDAGSPKSRSKPPASKPTLSLDKLTINRAAPPALGTPPELTRSRSRSPLTPTTLAFTPPRSRPAQSPTTPADRNDSFPGLFTQAYLPLLESRPHPSQTPPEPSGSSGVSPTSGPPTAAAVASSGQNRSSSHSPLRPPQSPAIRRALTSPDLGTSDTAIPSALRTASGTTVRVRKRVTFQLADSTVVEPSSSYEEMPSPNPPESKGEEEARIEMMLDDARTDRQNASEAEAPGVATTAAAVAVAAAASAQAPIPRSTELPEQAASSSNSIISSRSGSEGEAADENAEADDASPHFSSASLPEADDGGSGVGFFELEEELASPRLASGPRFGNTDEKDEYDDDDDEEEEPQDEDDEELLDPAGEERSEPGAAQKAASHDEDNERGGGGGGEARRNNAHHRRAVAAARAKRQSSFHAGSVPIDIVRPTGSWIGSFGH